ncbi:MAG: hypothetical protein ACR2KG_01780 [Nocardioidaceae bacterium]
MSTRIGSIRDQHPHVRLIPALAKVAMIGIKEGRALAVHDGPSSGGARPTDSQSHDPADAVFGPAAH